jgi:hypothetical protein
MPCTRELAQCCGVAPLVTIMTMMTIWVARGGANGYSELDCGRSQGKIQ